MIQLARSFVVFVLGILLIAGCATTSPQSSALSKDALIGTWERAGEDTPSSVEIGFFPWRIEIRAETCRAVSRKGEITEGAFIILPNERMMGCGNERGEVRLYGVYLEDKDTLLLHFQASVFGFSAPAGALYKRVRQQS